MEEKCQLIKIFDDNTEYCMNTGYALPNIPVIGESMAVGSISSRDFYYTSIVTDVTLLGNGCIRFKTLNSTYELRPLGYRKDMENDLLYLEYYGACADCKVFNTDVEEEAISQVYKILNCEAFEGSKIRIMCDIHAGEGAVIGFTATRTSKVIANIVGVDIGCGIKSIKLGTCNFDRESLDNFIRVHIPSGTSVRARPYKKMEWIYNQFVKTNIKYDDFISKISEICKITNQEEGRVLSSVGTLGGGNHFIEVDFDGTNYWLTLHSGSRKFGLDIAKYHQKVAVSKMGKKDKLEWLEGNDAELYLGHMKIAQIYAKLNRYSMSYQIVEDFFKLQLKDLEVIESVHNYINFEDNIIRKGAISAHKGEKVVIPWNMKDGLVVGEGKGNEDWNCSAPHGAGRKMSRSAAKKNLDLTKFENEMKDAGIWSSCVSQDTLDECADAYKDPEEIKKLLSPTVEVKLTLKPVYNFKASEKGDKKWQKKSQKE